MKDTTQKEKKYLYIYLESKLQECQRSYHVSRELEAREPHSLSSPAQSS